MREFKQQDRDLLTNLRAHRKIARQLEAKQQMLGTDKIISQPQGFFPAEGDDLFYLG